MNTPLSKLAHGSLEREAMLLASRGVNKATAANLLGITPSKFRILIADYPSICWSTQKTPTPSCLKGRSRCTLAMRWKRSINSWRTLGQITGNIDVIVEFYSAQGKCSVTASTVRRRLQSGMTLEESVFRAQTPVAKRKSLRWPGRSKHP